MSTVTINVTYGFQQKKFTVAKTSTVSQLASEAASYFKVLGVPKLVYKEKPLDSGLLIRLTPLLQNSLVKLEAGAALSLTPITVKVTGDGGNFIIKTTNTNLLREVLEEIEKRDGMSLIKDHTEVMIMNTNYNDLSIPLLQAVGDASTAVIRVRYPAFGSGDKLKEQREIVVKQLAEQKVRNEALRRKREEEEDSKRARIREEEKNNNLNEDNKETELTDEYTSEKPTEQNGKATSSVSPLPQHPAKRIDSHTSIERRVPKEGSLLYAPEESAPQVYENPESDYLVTVDQARLYHQLVTKSARRTLVTPSAKPEYYQIRIRLPDRNLLEFTFVDGVESVKLGQLIKRIDDVLLDDWVGNYRLKLAYPPFSAVPQSFTANGTTLHDLPQWFNTEKVTLVWQENHPSNSGGPYLQPGAALEKLTTSDLPEMKIESLRQQLPEDNESEPTPPLKSLSTSAPKKSEAGVPKWLKLGK